MKENINQQIAIKDLSWSLGNAAA